jgi:hypothetical protein
VNHSELPIQGLIGVETRAAGRAARSMAPVQFTAGYSPKKSNRRHASPLIWPRRYGELLAIRSNDVNILCKDMT